MITLVTGGTKCGKSGYAERILERFEGRKYYIATMNPVGDDAEEIIEEDSLAKLKGRFGRLR